MKISVISPSIRPELLEIVAKCLKKQTFQEFNWFIGSPQELFIEIDRLVGHEYDFTFIPEPPKNEGDFYCLCKCMNSLYRATKGELIIQITDGIWFAPDTLERLWSHYQVNPKGLVTTIGHQYDGIDENGKPSDMVWQDPRARLDQGTFYEVAPSEMEMCIASLPKQAILDCGGIDEVYDTCPAVGEKEMCWRLDKLGYKFYIDQTIEYRAIHHPRLSSNWEEMYLNVTTPLFIKHMDQLQKGQRTLNVDFVKSKIG